jgi:hypothetical protein
VAELSGVGVTWYTFLEQGRNVSPSAQVVAALARALALNPDQRKHLYDLAGLVTPGPEGIPGDMSPRLQRLVDAVSPSIASVYDAHFDYLVWNAAYVRVRNDPDRLPADRRNLVWMMFTDVDNRSHMVAWEPAARAVLSQFRAAVGQRPDDPRFTEIVSSLTCASPEFATWWPEYPVRYFKPATIGIEHPQVGTIDLEIFQLRLMEHPELLLVMQVPAGSADRDRVMSLLRAA